jgi:hypothetical protein
MRLSRNLVLQVRSEAPACSLNECREAFVIVKIDFGFFRKSPKAKLVEIVEDVADLRGVFREGLSS